jgi:hypothetical protein
MLREHVVMEAPLAQKIFATQLAHKLFPLVVDHLVVNLQAVVIGKLLAAVLADHTDIVRGDNRQSIT